ncbi:MAG: SRPBCC family protein [Micropepsaceae bacterium]
MLRNILIGLVVLAALVVGGAYLTPQNAHVERSTIMAATPEEVFSVVNDLSRFNEWSPWAKLDPNAKYTMDGAPSGVGAKMSWTSADANVGNGSQEIIESEQFSLVKTKLDFGDQGTAFGTLTFAPAEGGTKVTWAFDSDLGMNPIARYMGLMFDSWIGKDYESGLANLKAIVEKGAQAATAAALATPGSGPTPPDIPMSAAADPTKGPEVVNVAAKAVIQTRASAKATDNAAISAALGAANQKLLNYGMANELQIGGAPLAITISHSADGDWVFDAAMPLAEKPAKAVAEADGVKVTDTYAGRAVKLTHKGPYNTMNDTYARIHEYTKAQGLKEKSVAWEEYVGDPSETEDAELLTNVYIAVE